MIVTYIIIRSINIIVISQQQQQQQRYQTISGNYQ